jgi:MerR family copper efflux transcriptional regulator
VLTIGQLAKRVGLRPSALRYYEQEGLLQPDGRSEAGYRLYQPESEQRLRFIQRAQRLGFSLADIRALLIDWQAGDLNNQALIETAENRYLALEQQITDRLILQHELALFLQDLHQQADIPLEQLFARVWHDPHYQTPTVTILDLLNQYTDCHLTSDAGQDILNRLRGQHVHVWQEGDGYHVLVVSNETAVAEALQQLAQLETECHAHAQAMPQFAYEDEGYLFTATGDRAFIFARLFLSLERETTIHSSAVK